jgi:hypothetical protein
VGIAAALTIMAIAAMLIHRRKSLLAVDLKEGVEVQVLKISAGKRHFYSEDKGWRRFALERLPDRWLDRLGILSSVFIRPDGSLVLWVTETQKKTHEPIQTRVDSAFVQFSDGRWANGILTAIKSNVTQVEFPIYPRADSEISVRLREDANQAAFKVTNPNPGRLEHWVGTRLPLTNDSAMCEVVVSGDPRYLLMQMRDRSGDALDWMQYRVEVHDTAGNVDRIISNGSRIENFAARTYQPGPLKMMVRPREFISAGFVTNQTPGTIQEMEVSARAAKLGMEKFYFLSRGEYLIRNGTPNLHSGAPLGPNVEMTTTNSTGQWDVHLAARRPTVVTFYPSAVKVEGFDARLRERTRRGNGGAIFEMYRPPYESRSLAPVRILRQFETPLTQTTNALEAEIIVRHQPVEFVIDRTGWN